MNALMLGLRVLQASGLPPVYRGHGLRSRSNSIDAGLSPPLPTVPRQRGQGGVQVTCVL